MSAMMHAGCAGVGGTRFILGARKIDYPSNSCTCRRLRSAVLSRRIETGCTISVARLRLTDLRMI